MVHLLMQAVHLALIVFPKTQSASDVMSQAPSEVEPKQLKELHIKPDIEEEEEQSLV